MFWFVRLKPAGNFFLLKQKIKVTKKEKHTIFVSCFLGEPEIIVSVSRTPNSGLKPLKQGL